MSAQVFVYALLLKTGDQGASLMDVLPEERRQFIQNLLERTKAIPGEELRGQWQQLRTDQQRQQQAAALKRIPNLKRFSPRLQQWLSRWR